MGGLCITGQPPKPVATAAKISSAMPVGGWETGGTATSLSPYVAVVETFSVSPDATPEALLATSTLPISSLSAKPAPYGAINWGSLELLVANGCS